MSQFGGNKGTAQLLKTCGVEANRAPDSGVAVAYAVTDGEVPTDGHELGDVLANPTVAAVVPLTSSSPALRHSKAGYIDRIDADGKGCHLTRLHGAVSNVERLTVEHTIHLTNHIAVDPNLSPIVDAHRFEPDALALVLGRHNELCAEPIGIELSSHFGEVRDDVVCKLVGLSVVRFGINFLLHEIRQNSCRYDGFCPAFGVESRPGNLSSRGFRLSGTEHVPSLTATMLKAGVEGNVRPSVVSRSGQHYKKTQ